MAAACLAGLLGVAALRPRAAHGTPSLGQLGSQLSQQQARQQSLSASLASLGRELASLNHQVALVQQREALVGEELAADRAALARVSRRLAVQRRWLAVLRARLARARMILSRQLVAGYEHGKPDLVTVLLNADGFNQLLEQLAFLGRAQHQQQSIITITRQARAQAAAGARRLTALQRSDRALTRDTYLRAQALAGMNALLSARQAAAGRARSAQQAAMGASRAEASRLQSEISRVRAQQAAAAAARAAAAAAQAAQSSPTPVSTPGAPPALGPSGGWAIPYAIVLCESGGQNLPPNGAGASGYYQILPSTWKLFGGTGPAAYLASKAEQDAVATRIWDGGRGASNWVCSSIVGIH